MEQFDTPVYEFDAEDGYKLRIAVIPQKMQFGFVIVKNGERVSPLITFTNVNVVAIIHDLLQFGLTNMRRYADNWNQIPYTSAERTLTPLGIQDKVRRLK